MSECKNCEHDEENHFIVGCVEKDEIDGEECGCLQFKKEEECYVCGNKGERVHVCLHENLVRIPSEK